MTATHTNTDRLAHLAFTPACDILLPIGQPGPTSADCTNPATWTLNFHTCKTTGIGTWCDTHLAEATLHIKQWITHARIHGATAACIPCGHEFREISDGLWNLQPLN